VILGGLFLDGGNLGVVLVVMVGVAMLLVLLQPVHCGISGRGRGGVLIRVAMAVRESR
jgi:hypothetical protein